MSDQTDEQWTPAEIVGLEDDVPAVPVTVEGIVRVEELPTIPGGARTWFIPTGTAVRVLPADPHRKRAQLRAVQGGVNIGNKQSDVTDPAALVNPSTASFAAFRMEAAAEDLEIHHTGEVWASVRAGIASSQLAVWVELWAR